MGIANRRSRGCPCASKGVRWWGKTARLSAPFRHFVECRTVSLGQRARPPDGTHDEGEAQPMTFNKIIKDLPKALTPLAPSPSASTATADADQGGCWPQRR